MIKVPDLCIGNGVYDGDGTQFPMWVQAIGDDYVYLNFEGSEADPWETTPEELEGIPLTEELMTDNGFCFNGVWWHKHEANYVLDVSVGLAYVQIEKWADSGIHSRCTCHGVRFVHELQNLFWNITKQQLNIKL
jgi:hypothetical protein